MLFFIISSDNDHTRFYVVGKVGLKQIETSTLRYCVNSKKEFCIKDCHL